MPVLVGTFGPEKQIAEIGVPEVPDFLDQIVAAGGQLWACRMSADTNELTETDLRDDVEGITSASNFIDKTAGASCCSSELGAPSRRPASTRASAT